MASSRWQRPIRSGSPSPAGWSCRGQAPGPGLGRSPGARAPSRPRGRSRPGRRRGAGRALWCCGRRHGRAARTGRGGRPVVTAGIGDVAPRRLEHGRDGPAGAERGERGLRCGRVGVESDPGSPAVADRAEVRSRPSAACSRGPIKPAAVSRSSTADSQPCRWNRPSSGRGSRSQASRSAAAATTSRTSASLQRRSDEVMAWLNSSTQVGGFVGSVAREFTAGW